MQAELLADDSTPSADATTTLLTQSMANDRGEAVVPLCPGSGTRAADRVLATIWSPTLKGDVEDSMGDEILPKRRTGYAPRTIQEGYKHSSPPQQQDIRGHDHYPLHYRLKQCRAPQGQPCTRNMPK